MALFCCCSLRTVCRHVSLLSRSSSSSSWTGTRMLSYTTSNNIDREEDSITYLSRTYTVNDSNSTPMIGIQPFLKDISRTGLQLNDPRIATTVNNLQTLADTNGLLQEAQFIQTIQSSCHLFHKALEGQLVVSDFNHLTETVDSIYNECADINEGENASYIPELARIDPSLWGVSICTIDGQRHSIGDSNHLFTIQSGGKCFNYAVGCDQVGTDEVHKYIGMESSGSHFNRMVLNMQGKPHNPMINSGALVLVSLLKPHLSLHERVDFMLSKFDEFSGLQYRSIKCDMITCDSEMDNCDRNLALVHYIKSKNSFPANVSIDNTIKLYTRLCSVEIDCQKGAVMAATLANGGVCPVTDKQVVSSDSVRHTLTLMHSCGMYDFSGEFTFNVGLPAKSGVSGVIMLVVPGLMGICMYSPRVNSHGNSVTGLEYCRKLAKDLGLHLYSPNRKL